MDTIRTIQDHCYFAYAQMALLGGKSNLASNNVEDIDLPIVFVSIASTL